MLVFNASPFLGAFGMLSTLSQMLTTLRAQNVAMGREQFHEFKEALEKFHAECVALGLVMCAASAQRAITQLNLVAIANPGKAAQVQISALYAVPLHGALQEVGNRLKDEIASRMLVVIPAEQVQFYEQNPPLFGTDFTAKFPSAQYDLEEAGKSLALGRSTAAVFHLMRIVELGMGAVHHCLGIAVALTGNDRNWGNILKRIRDDITARPKWTEKDAFQEIYAMMDAVKDAWRNATMHVENKYTEEEARRIYDAVRGFMMKLASRMDEQGMPKV